MEFKGSINRDIVVWKNKSLEFQLDWGWMNNMASEWFEFILKSNSRQDHWGAEFRLTLLNLFCLMIQFYDHRHYYNDDDIEIELDDVDDGYDDLS